MKQPMLGYGFSQMCIASITDNSLISKLIEETLSGIAEFWFQYWRWKELLKIDSWNGCRTMKKSVAWLALW